MGPEPSRPSPPASSPAAKTVDDAKADDTDGYTPMVSTTHPTPVLEDMEGENFEEDIEGRGADFMTFDLATAKGSPPADPKSPKERVTEEDSLPREESKDWLDLPMLAKLESMHLLTEWQFQNPQRFRTIMRNDDEAALWVCNFLGVSAWPIHFDARAYALSENRAYRIRCQK